MSRTTKTPALDPSVPLAACAVCGREFPLGQMASPSAEPWHEGMPLVCQDRETRCLSRYAKGERYHAPDSRIGVQDSPQHAIGAPEAPPGIGPETNAGNRPLGRSSEAGSLLVYLCSPFREYTDADGNRVSQATNRGLAIMLRERIGRLGHYAIVPHVDLTAFLDDAIPAEREMGLHLGLEALAKADVLFVFGEYLSGGMREEIRRAAAMAIPMRWFKDCVPDVSDRDDTDLLVAALGRVAEVTL